MVGSSRRPSIKKQPTFFFHLILSLCASLTFLLAKNATGTEGAAPYDGDACVQYIQYYEQVHTIPDQLLYAIALTESGRWHKESHRLKPWPWTINVAGTPYVFDTKTAAINAVKRFRRQGVNSIDIGCMQVNLLHHPAAFASLEQAFDPGYNVRYAAKFLMSNYQRSTNWQHAIGAYHSLTAHLGKRYTDRVLQLWRSHAAGRTTLAEVASRASANGAPHISSRASNTKEKMRHRATHSQKKSVQRLRSNLMITVHNNHNDAESADTQNHEREALRHITERVLDE